MPQVLDRLVQSNTQSVSIWTSNPTQITRFDMKSWTSAPAADTKTSCTFIDAHQKIITLTARDAKAFFCDDVAPPSEKALERAAEFNSGRIEGSNYHW